MSPLRRLAAAAIGAALLGVFLPAAHAAAPSEHGYWWRLQKSSGPRLPPPKFVPPDGLWVATDSSGQLAVSALRYRAPVDEEIRTLVLNVSQNTGTGALLLACPASGNWQPAEAGAWSAQPAYSCDVGVKGVVSADQKTWSFDVRGLGRSGTLNVVILQPPDVKSHFSIAFLPPGPSSIVTQRFPGSPSPPASSPRPPDQSSPGSSQPAPGASVLSEKTTPPTSAATNVEPVPSDGSPSPEASFEAAAPIELPPYRSPWIMAIAGLLPLAVLGGLMRAHWYD